MPEETLIRDSGISFRSILFGSATERPAEQLAAPDFFVDLNLDQIVASITARKDEYNLSPFFYMPLRELDDITFRQEIMRDLENARLADDIKAFAQKMRAVREHLTKAEKFYYKLQKQRWFLDAVSIYCDAVTSLAHDLCAANLTARGLLGFTDFIVRYAGSERFISLCGQTNKLAAELAAVNYTVLIDGLRVQVRRYDGQPDYSAEVEATFEKFQHGAVKEYVFKFSDPEQMNHVEAQIITLVSQLYPGTFSTLENYCTANKDFQDNTVIIFDREIQFYIAYLEYLARFKSAGLSFCYPRVVRHCKQVYSYESFDLALARKLEAANSTTVCNDFQLSGKERMLVVSGPNQGGKTTFSRTFGQLHYLASLGCPVPGTGAQLFLFDRLFTHFEREEDIKNLRGKLQDDLIRIHQIFEQATPNSIVIMNEIFTSTTLQDAVLLSKKIAAKLLELDALSVWVTFVEEIASLSQQTVSMVSTVVPENPALRTYKIIRRAADGLAYAMAIAEKHHLTYAMIKERTNS